MLSINEVIIVFRGTFQFKIATNSCIILCYKCLKNAFSDENKVSKITPSKRLLKFVIKIKHFYLLLTRVALPAWLTQSMERYLSLPLKWPPFVCYSPSSLRNWVCSSVFKWVHGCSKDKGIDSKAREKDAPTAVELLAWNKNNKLKI